MEKPTSQEYTLNEVVRTGPFEIRFPDNSKLDQDEEWCEVKIDGKWKKIRFHDYHEVYKIPGLYETIFYRTLRCISPTEVASLLRTVMLEREINAKEISALDFGAGNGMAGEALQTLGIRRIVGIDILEEAKSACLRDRPWVYNDYLVADFTELSEQTRSYLKDLDFNMLVTIAALGYGDIPVKAFYNAYNLIANDGWIAFNIKEDFFKGSSQAGFSGLINRMYDHDIMQCEMYKRYCHRISITGKPLYYVAMVGKKLSDIPEPLLDEVLNYKA